MSRDAFPRFFDSDEPEQRHRVLIEFGLCAGVAFHPLRACPFISSWLEHFWQTSSTGVFFAGLRFQFDAIYRPHPHAATACCRPNYMHARVPLTFDHLTREPCPFSRIGRLLASACSAHGSPHSRPTLTNTHSAGGIANGVRCPSYLTGTLNVRYDTVGLAAPWQMARSGRGMGIPCFPPSRPARPLDYCISPGMDRCGQGFRGSGVIVGPC